MTIKMLLYRIRAITLIDLEGFMNTKERILAAAIHLFNQQGTAQVSTNHIAREAGISPGNLYYHYKNKAEIIHSILEQMYVRWDEVWYFAEDQPLTLESFF